MIVQLSFPCKHKMYDEKYNEIVKNGLNAISHESSSFFFLCGSTSSLELIVQEQMMQIQGTGLISCTRQCHLINRQTF